MLFFYELLRYIYPLCPPSIPSSLFACFTQLYAHQLPSSLIPDDNGFERLEQLESRAWALGVVSPRWRPHTAGGSGGKGGVGLALFGSGVERARTAMGGATRCVCVYVCIYMD